MAAAKKKTTTRRKKKAAAEPESRGLTAAQVGAGSAPARIASLQQQVEQDGGRVLGVYRDPLGGHWQLLASLPLSKVEPTPYQRDLSPAHVERLADRIGRLDRFLDPVVAYRTPQGRYWTPNGHHRTAALRQLGARSVVALVLPDEEIAFKILALNTEKAHNVREKALEVVRMARALAQLDPRPEKDYAIEFEEPSLLTLGLCYEQRGRFSGGAYQPVLKRLDRFSSASLDKALARREERVPAILALDDAVGEAVDRLKERGLQSPYLKAFVVARINPLRFQRGASAKAADLDETLAKMTASAKKLDANKVRADQLAGASGPPEE